MRITVKAANAPAGAAKYQVRVAPLGPEPLTSIYPWGDHTPLDVIREAGIPYPIVRRFSWWDVWQGTTELITAERAR